MKSLTDNLALFSVTALALGLYRLFRYYSIFGIDIVNYIEVTEILQAQFFALLGIVMILPVLILSAMVLLSSEIKFSEPDSISKYLQKQDNFGLYNIGILIIGGVMLLFIACGSLSASDAQDILRGKRVQDVVLVMDKDTIKTNSSLVYIGKTRNYVFLYDKVVLQSRILKTEDIKEIRIYRKIRTR